MLIPRKSKLWLYLDDHLKGLVKDSEYLLKDASIHKKRGVSDYSYLVFPLSKAYEGFLKRFFLDLSLIDSSEFLSDDIRIGRVLNPAFRHEKSSVYGKFDRKPHRELSDLLWLVWKNGRNLVFHYYPHNFRRLSMREAEELIKDVVGAMTEAVKVVKVSHE